MARDRRFSLILGSHAHLAQEDEQFRPGRRYVQWREVGYEQMQLTDADACVSMTSGLQGRNSADIWLPLMTQPRAAAHAGRGPLNES